MMDKLNAFNAEKRKSELNKILEKVDEDKRTAVAQLLEEVVFLEEQLTELRGLPMIRRHPRDPSHVKRTEAAKMYKETMQSYKDAVRILLSVLNKVETSAQDELLSMLKQFE